MTALDKARAAWGTDLPDWVIVLAKQSDNTSQATVAIRVRISSAAVSQAINRKYAGDYGAVEAKVRGALMGHTVPCPVQGEIALDVCMRNQGHGLTTSSPQRQRLGRTCPTCEFRHHGGKNHAE